MTHLFKFIPKQIEVDNERYFASNEYFCMIDAYVPLYRFITKTNRKSIYVNRILRIKEIEIILTYIPIPSLRFIFKSAFFFPNFDLFGGKVDFRLYCAVHAGNVEKGRIWKESCIPMTNMIE